MRCVGVLFCLGCLCAADPAVDQRDPAQVRPTRIFSPPRIDGALDDSVWQEAALIPNIPSPGKTDGPKTAIRLAYDHANLYFAWICFEPHLADLVTTYCPTRDAGWGDDNIEIFVQPMPPNGTVFQIVINAANVVADYRHAHGRADRAWDSAVRTAVGQRSNAWTVEAALPWADLELDPGTGPVMGLNLARWHPQTRTNCHWGRPGHGTNIEFLGRMKGVELDFSGYDVTVASPRLTAGLCFGQNIVPVTLKNIGLTPKTVQLEGDAVYPDGLPAVAPPVSQRLILAPGHETLAALHIPLPVRTGCIGGCLRVIDADSGIPLRQLTRYAVLPDPLLNVRLDRRYLFACDHHVVATIDAHLGEGSLASHCVTIRSTPAAGPAQFRHVALTDRLANIPIDVRDLPLGDSVIVFELRAMDSSNVLQKATTRVVRLLGPFDRQP